MHDLKKGLVGHWELNEESYNPTTKRLTDKSAYSNHGTSANTMVTGTDRMGNADEAMVFDGLNDYVQIADNSSLDITEAITIAAWIYPTGLGESNSDRIVDKNISSGYSFYFITDTLKIGFACNNALVIKYSDNDSIELNKWQHVVITYDKTDVRFYVDGVYAGGGAETASLGSNNDPLYIGNSASNDNTFGGLISDARIYNRALDQTEITRLYNSYKPILSTGSLLKGLVGHWELNEEREKRFPYAEFNGTSDYVNLGSDASLDFETGNGTWSGWLKFGVYQGVSRQIYSGSAGGGYHGFGLVLVSSNSMKVEIYGTSGGRQNRYVNSTNYLDEWHHWSFVITKADHTIKVYIDNNLINTFVLNDWGSITTVNDIVFGSYYTSTVWFFDGSISDVRIYNRDLTTDEISTIAIPRNIGKDVVVDNNLKGWWRLNDYDDSSGNGNNGTNHGSVITHQTISDKSPHSNNGTVHGTKYCNDRMGHSNQAMVFDGDNDYIEIADDATLDIIEDITIAAWIYPTEVGEASQGAIVDKNINTGYFFSLYDLALRFSSDNVGIFQISNSDVITLNKWQHVVITYNMTDIKFYVDSVYAGGGSSIVSLSQNNNSLFIGNREDGARAFDGVIDEVRIYNRALSQAEITQLFNTYKN